MAGYSANTESEKSARALGVELRISPKHSVEVCRAIRGMSLKLAKSYLEEVKDLKRAVPFLTYKWEIGHRRGPGFGKGSGYCTGRYPRKAAEYILKILEDVENNAEYKGLDIENLKIVHIAAQRGTILEGRTGRAHGSTSAWNEHTTNIEVIVEEAKE
ncbi:MAG: 50S ribosomal protein L22 [Thermoplasmata archaeon]